METMLIFSCLYLYINKKKSNWSDKGADFKQLCLRCTGQQCPYHMRESLLVGNYISLFFRFYISFLCDHHVLNLYSIKSFNKRLFCLQALKYIVHLRLIPGKYGKHQWHILLLRVDALFYQPTSSVEGRITHLLLNTCFLAQKRISTRILLCAPEAVSLFHHLELF